MADTKEKSAPEPIPTYTVPKPRDETKDALGRPAQDVFAHQNPNGVVIAEISAKFPKAGGETFQEVQGDGRILERSVDQDQALATAAGGPEGAEEGTAPGPKPQAAPTGFGGGGTAAATASGKEGETVAKETAKAAAEAKPVPTQMELNRQDAEKQQGKK